MSRLPPAPIVVGQDSVTQRAARMPPVQRTASSSSSGSSHSSHSSHIEREREAHLGEAADQLPSVAKPIAAAIAILTYIFLAQALGLWLFTKGFLLTRTTLENTSTCTAPITPSWNPPKPAFTSTSIEGDTLKKWEESLISQAECSLPPTYKRTILWIVDALRYDYIADAEPDANSTWLPNPHYHNVFQLPNQLHKDRSSTFSFLSHFLADAPTTTIQRLKGLTTGSLPTFIDAGSNFGGSLISEDNWLAQLRAKYSTEGKAGMGFVGDKTWEKVFPNAFDKAWTWPFDSFNVEDLDGVDRGVEAKLDDFLQPNSFKASAEWRLLVAHMLGVDHVGHRLGASHPRMKVKLQEMNLFMKRVVDQLPKDALLVLMGDHGMDERGDHGGDGELEVGSGLWMYSKATQVGGGISQATLAEITAASKELVPTHIPFSPLPFPLSDSKGHRSVPQIDFVPTISLLMGLPVPFNNLGSVIPEAFGSLDLLLRALRINALQIHRYLEEYSMTSQDLKSFQAEIKDAWQQALKKDAIFALASHGNRASREQALKDACSAYMAFNRTSLVRAKSIWAKFEMNKMITGLCLLFVSLATCLAVKSRAAKETDIVLVLVHLLHKSKMGAALGAFFLASLKVVSLYAIPIAVLPSLSLVEAIGVGAALGGQFAYIVSSSPGIPWSFSSTTLIGAALPILHSLAFSSNSFTVHEDRIVLALAVLALAYRGVQGYLGGPTTRIKIRLPAFAILSMIALRLSSIFKVCREEQGPDCVSTFYSGSGTSLNSIYAIAVAYLCALLLPIMVASSLNLSKSFAGVAIPFTNWMLRPALLMASGYWFVDWVFTAESFSLQEETSAYTVLTWAKLILARADMALIVVVGLSFWVFSPLCLELTKESVESSDAVKTPATSQQQEPSGQRIVVLGFANSFGSSYLLLLSLVFSLLFLVAQPSGQIALTLAGVALSLCAEIGDGERDTALLSRQVAKVDAESSSLPTTSLPISFLETSTLALIGFVVFFSTGHQATLSTIQWRTAFVGFEKVNYPFSPILVSLNSFGALALLPSMTVALLVLWNLAPRPRAAPASKEKTEKMPAVMHILQGSLSFLLYHFVVTLSASAFAAHFKRHLMLFAVWTPRFMLSVVSLQVTFLGLMLGLIASGVIMSKVTVTFGSQF
ncbi:hypothetical protein CBS101457_006380 [Exobasidium rhododendri]|nr:hypothetical protein CBS101457_006380 [Exobasidium rhododendri]